MAASVIASGTQTCTVDTTHLLGSGLTGPSGGAHYALLTDANALVGGEQLTVIISREAFAAGTQRVLWRGVVASGIGGTRVQDSPILRLPEGIDGKFEILQQGGTGRAILWSIERVDG